MNIDDYELLKYGGHRLRKLPELPGSDTSKWARCTFCLACPDGDRDADLCYSIQRASRGCEGGYGAAVWVPEERFNEYVVEYVRRRVS